MQPLRLSHVVSPFVLSFVLAHVPAQEPAPTTTTTAVAAPEILIETVGPDGWRMRLGPTNLGSLLASEQGRALWSPRVDPLMGMWQHVLGDEAAFRTAREAVLGYGGRVRIAAWLTPGNEGGGQLARAAIVLDGDGRTDLGKLAAEVRNLQAQLDGKWTKTDVGGTATETIVHGEDAMTAPIVDGKSILIALGSPQNLGQTVASARSIAVDPGAKFSPTSPALRVRLDAAALAKRFDAPAEVATALGLDSLGAMTFAVGTAGPRVQVEIGLSFVGDERGLLAGLFPASQGVPDLQRFCDPKSSWKVGRFDWLAVWLAAERLLQTRSIGAENVRAEATKELGVDPVDGLLAHLTDEVMLSIGTVGDAEELRDTPWTFAVRLRDEAAFAKGVDIALAKAKPMLSREATVENADGNLQRYGNFLGYDLWITTGQGLFALAAGDGAEDRLKALLAAAKAAKEKPAVDATKTADFESLARHVPAGLNGVARGEVDSMIGIPLGAWVLGMGEISPQVFGVEVDVESREQFMELLAKHELHTIRTASGFADRRWLWRMFW